MKRIIWILFFIIGILIPCFTYIYDNLNKTMVTNSYNLEVTNEIIKGNKISQEIYVPGKINKFGLMFGTYMRKNSGKVKISFEQNHEIKTEKTLDVSEIENDKINYIKMNFSKIKKGKATLIVEGIDGKENNSIVLYKSSDVSLGKIDKEPNNKGLVFEMSYYLITKTVIIQIFYLFLTGMCYTLIYKMSRNNKKYNKRLYFLTSIMIFFMINVKVPIVSFNSEPYVETLSNFLFFGRNENFLNNLFISDSGYWPLFQRLIGLVIIKLFHFNLKWIIFIMQNTGVIFITLFSSLFVLEKFQKYGIFLFRLCIAIILGGGVTLTSSIEGYYFFNFTYYGIVALIFISLLDLNKLSKKIYIFILIFSFFINISKLYFIILFPITIFIFLFFWKKITDREKLYLIIISFSNFIQILYIKFNNSGNGLLESKINIPDINNLLYRITQQFIFLFFPEVNNSYNIAFLNITFLIIWFLFIGLNIYFFVSLKNKEIVISLILILIIIGTTFLNILTTGKMFGWNSEFEWMKTSNIINMRHSLFINISYITLLVLTLYNINILFFKNNSNFMFYEKFKNFFYLIMIFVLIIRFSAFDNNVINSDYPVSLKKEEVISDWNNYNVFFKESDYIIPFNHTLALSKGNINIYSVTHNKLEKLMPVLVSPEQKKLIKYNRGGVFWLGKTAENINQTSEISFEKEISVSYIYAERLRANNLNKIKAIGFNKNNEIVWNSEQLNNPEKQFVGFKINNSEKIKRIKFYTFNNNITFVKDRIFIGTFDEY